MSKSIAEYHEILSPLEREICEKLEKLINQELKEAESKIWHGHPVWFLDDNPIVGYSQQKNGIKLLFWSGADFNEEALDIRAGKFKDASCIFQTAASIKPKLLNGWLKKSRDIQWDYKNLVKRKGELIKLK